jgi:glycosyltransferase involved in cell wall biosynthesis
MSQQKPLLTIASVVRNAATDVEAFHARLAEEVRNLPDRIDILYVDDGSNDATGQILRRIACEDLRVRVLQLSRTFGYRGATSAALVHATGDAMILIERRTVSLSIIPQMIERWREGYELIWAKRSQDLHASHSRWWAQLAARIETKLQLPGCDEVEAALFGGRVVDIYRSLGHRDEHVVSALASYGFRQTSFEVYQSEAPFEKGSASARLRELSERLVDYSVVPVRTVSGIGVALGIVAFLYSLIIIIRSIFFGLGDYGWPSQVITLLFLGSAQMISLGIIVEYVWRIYQQTRQTPRYVIKEVLGTPARILPSSCNLDPHDLDLSTLDDPGHSNAPQP